MENWSSSLVIQAYLFAQNSDFGGLYMVGKKIQLPTTFVLWVFSNSEVFLAENIVKSVAGGDARKLKYLVVQF